MTRQADSRVRDAIVMHGAPFSRCGAVQNQSCRLIPRDRARPQRPAQPTPLLRVRRFAVACARLRDANVTHPALGVTHPESRTNLRIERIA